LSRISWNAPGERFFESGVDRGVLYVGTNPGVSWTGLISVAESPSGGEARPYYQDGIKYVNISAKEEFEATINAFTAPKEFAPCDGVAAMQNGLFATQQPRKAFSLSYRTLIGNDVDGQEHAYKIHLVYNALAGPSERSNSTLGDNVEPNSLSWQITTLPPSLTGMKPTAHFVIDSRYTPPNLLAAIEDIIYGSDAADPRMPLASELVALFKSDGPVIRRNLITNPTWRLPVVTTVEIRRNIFRNPSCSVNATDWAFAVGSTGGAVTAGRVAADGSFVVNGQSLSYYRGTWTNVGNGAIASTGPLFGNPNADAIPVAAGTTYYVSAYARCSRVDRTANMIATTHDAAGGSQTVVLTTATVAIGGVNMVRLSGMFTAPAGATRLYVRVYSVGGGLWVNGDTMDVGGVLVEAASVLLPFFNGDTTGLDAQRTAAWTATAGASQAILKGPAPASGPFTSYGSTPGMVGWQSALGIYRILAKRDVPSSSLYGFSALSVTPAETGKFYSGRIKVRQLGGTTSVPISPALAAYTAAPAIVNVVAGSSSLDTLIPPNSDWIEISVVASATAGAAVASVRWLIYQDSGSATTPAGAVLEFKEGLIEEVDNVAIPAGYYFDGETPDVDIYKHNWEGPVDNSTSTANSWF